MPSHPDYLTSAEIAQIVHLASLAMRVDFRIAEDISRQANRLLDRAAARELKKAQL
jgi:hypothetical protein